MACVCPGSSPTGTPTADTLVPVGVLNRARSGWTFAQGTNRSTLWLSRSYWAGRFFGWIKVTLKEHCLSSKFRAGPEAAAWSAARRDTTLQDAARSDSNLPF
ncbi:unnamed protein product [Durusdinium trenchii]|uniref:Uncharacterized protein n=2 Tax=Durusdinium trenchii TaxID=1381693 RepID=A0ABP0HNX5_9DINO